MTKRVQRFLIICAFMFFSISLLFPEASMGDIIPEILGFVSISKLANRSSIPDFAEFVDKMDPQLQTSGFGMAVIGSGTDSIFCLTQCHHNISSRDCVRCFTEAKSIIPMCLPRKGMQVFLNGCFLRIDNYSFFQEYTSPEDITVCRNRRRSTIFRQAVSQAVSIANVTMGYTISKSPVLSGTNESAYALTDCWKSLNAISCRACLEKASASLLECLPSSKGFALKAGCVARYSDTNFLDLQSGNVSLRENGSTRGNRRGSNGKEKSTEGFRDFSLIFKYSVLKKATGSFDDANMLGQGGFGTVYKGTLPDGREIAVERLFLNNKHKAADFYNEVNIISSIRYKNLVRLLGCSCEGPESLLVYELLPNGSLDHLIFDDRSRER